MCFILIAINIEGDGTPELICKKDTREECEAEQDRLGEHKKQFEEREKAFFKELELTKEPNVKDYYNTSLAIWEKAKSDYQIYRSEQIERFYEEFEEPKYGDYYKFYVL